MSDNIKIKPSKTEILNQAFHEIEFSLNLSFTETMNLSWNENGNNTYLKCTIRIQDEECLNLKHFTQVGVWISYKKMSRVCKEIEPKVSLRVATQVDTKQKHKTKTEVMSVN